MTNTYQQLVSLLGRKPDIISDNAESKWGKTLFGLKCISPAELSLQSDTTTVVIAVRRYEPICSQLSQMGFKQIFVVCFDRSYDVVSQIKPLVSHSIDKVVIPGISVHGKWTLVTGASRGIGRQIAMEMARLGSHLILHGRSLEHVGEIVEICSGMGVQVKAVAAELGNEKELQKMLISLQNDFPPIDIVFNNAAISLFCGNDSFDIQSADFVQHYMVNTVAPIRICYTLLPMMIARGFGRIVNISSTIQDRPLEMPYACSKAALNKFVHDLAPSLQGTGVMLSLACPGFVSSDMGGPAAPHSVESVVPGILLGALLDADVNGRWLIAQDFAGMDLQSAMSKARFYYSLEED